MLVPSTWVKLAHAAFIKASKVNAAISFNILQYEWMLDFQYYIIKIDYIINMQDYGTYLIFISLKIKIDI